MVARPQDLPFPDEDLDELSRRIDAEAREAYQQFLRLVDEGTPPRDAIQQVLRGFNEAYYTELSAAFSRVLAEPWTVRQMRAYQVGDVTLSRKLYDHWRKTSAEVTAIIREHAQGMQQARELALALYQGYNFRDVEPLTVASGRLRTLPKPLRALAMEPAVRTTLIHTARRAASTRLRTAALRSAYEQAFDAAMAGASRPRLERLLQVAVHEKARYFANRIAQTELARAHADRVAQDLMADSTITVVQWRLSAAHPVDDICDVFARVDRYALGPGCYPKARAPKPIAHPHCRCRLRSRPDLDASEARENHEAERQFLRSMDDAEAARVMGSKRRLQQVRDGQDARSVWNHGKPSEYRVLALNEYGRAAKLPIPPSAPTTPPQIAAPVIAQPATIDDYLIEGRKITAELPDGAADPAAFVAALTRRMKDAGLTGKACRVAQTTPTAKLVQRASALYPASWVAAADALGSLFVRAQARGRGWHHTVESDSPAVRLPGFGILRNVKAGTGYVAVPSGDFGVAIHEYGHRLQAALPALDRIFQDLHTRRTAGQPLEQLGHLLGGGGYRRGEVTRKDQYTDAYQGKEYAGRGALEVLTMAYENLLGLAGGTSASHGTAERRFREFYTKDRELFDLVVGLLFNFKP